MTSQLLVSGPLQVIGAPHAFSTRNGGVSTGPFASLNFGNPSELPAGVTRDPKSNIEENFRRVLAAIGCEQRHIVQVHQVHQAAVHAVRPLPAKGRELQSIDWGSVKADALVTDDPRCVVVIRVADCCPVLLASNDGYVVAAVHAGWRGVIAGVLPAAIDEMRKLGAKEIIAAIGPCISHEHFEVGPEVVAEFTRVFGRSEIIRAHSDPAAAAAGKALIDLKQALYRQLVDRDVKEIDVLPHCTFRDEHLFFSHRRENGVTGRMIGVIGPRA